LVEVRLAKQSYTALDLAKLRLAPDVTNWFKSSSDLARFRAEFGDYFVSGYIQGGRLCFVVEIETFSSRDKTDAKAKIGGSGATWSASAEFKLAIDKMNKGRRISARILQTGSTWEFKDLDADSLFARALEFPNFVKAAPATLALELTEYDSIQNWPSAITSYTPLLEISNTLAELQDWHRQFQEILKDIDFVQDNLVAFKDADTGLLNELKELVEDEDKFVVGGMVTLVTAPLANLDLRPESVADDPRLFRAQLPIWRDDLPSCARDILASDPHAPDGDYDIWLDGDGFKRVQLFCKMGDNPREYLRLKNPNSSMLKGENDGGWKGTDVITMWQFIRLDPKTLEVDLNDFTGSRTQGGPTAGYSNIAFGQASQCGGNKSDEGFATIDISGTPFVFHPSVSFVASGDHASGRFTFGPTPTKVSYGVRGTCGGMTPSIAGAARLVLQYAG
jgi:hypothetical protein